MWWPTLHVPTQSRGVWGNAPPGNLCYLYALKSILGQIIREIVQMDPITGVCGLSINMGDYSPPPPPPPPSPPASYASERVYYNYVNVPYAVGTAEKCGSRDEQMLATEEQVEK